MQDSIVLDPEKRHRVCVCRNIVTTGENDPPGVCKCVWTDELQSNNGSCMTATIILIILTFIGIGIMLYSVSMDNKPKGRRRKNFS